MNEYDMRCRKCDRHLGGMYGVEYVVCSDCTTNDERDHSGSPWQQVGRMTLDLRTVLAITITPKPIRGATDRATLSVAFRQGEHDDANVLVGTYEECLAEYDRAKELLRYMRA